MCEVSRITQEPWQLHWWKFARGPNFEGLHASQRNEILMLSLCEGHVYSPLICLRTLTASVSIRTLAVIFIRICFYLLTNNPYFLGVDCGILMFTKKPL
ncbi:F-box protein [Trifolium repens]|nr:F-box protein [Trifolium repens]